MLVQIELDKLQQLGVDDELLIDLCMAITAKRSIAVKTAEKKAATQQIQCILRSLLGNEAVLLTASTQQQDLERILEETEVAIVEGIDEAPLEVQNHFHRIIKHNTRDTFTLIFLIDRKPTKPLLNDIWFESSFNPQSRPFDLHGTALADSLVQLRGNKVELIREIKTYIYDMIIFTRTNRFVIGGIPMFTLNDFVTYVKTYASLHGFNFVIPEMVQLAAQKLLPVRMTLLKNPEDEPSVMYGGEPALAQQIISQMTPQLIIEDVLKSVQPPV